MLIPNLSVLLAERRLTLSKVSEDTRISRTTLTALTAGHAKGVQFDTLNTLCQYLNVAPGDLFLYRPFDLTAASTGLPGHSAVTFTLRRAGRPEETHALACDAEYLFSDAHTLDALRVRLTSPKDDPRAADFLALLCKAQCLNRHLKRQVPVHKQRKLPYSKVCDELALEFLINRPHVCKNMAFKHRFDFFNIIR